MILAAVPEPLRDSSVPRVVLSGASQPVLAFPGADIVRPAFDGPATLEITAARDFARAVVRPASLRIVAQRLDEWRLRIDLPGPVDVSVEFDGDLSRPLLVLPHARAAVAGSSRATASAAGVLRLGPGRHEGSALRLEDGQTLELDPEAHIVGGLRLAGLRGVTVRGPGVIDGRSADLARSGHALLLEDCADLRIEGPLLLARGHWACVVRRCEDIEIENLRVVGHEVCSDGIDVDGSSRVRVRGGFLKTNDDCLCIKASPLAAGRPVEDVEFSGCVLWKGPCGNALELGYESQTHAFRRIAFRDLDIIHAECDHASGWVDRLAAIALHLTHDALVEDIVFERLRFEDVRTPKLVQLLVFHYWREHGWFSPEGRLPRGRVRGVTLRDVDFPGDSVPRVHVEGCNGPDDLADIVFERVRHGGQPLREHPGLVLEMINTRDFAWR